jgi:hypothetical protein
MRDPGACVIGFERCFERTGHAGIQRDGSRDYAADLGTRARDAYLCEWEAHGVDDAASDSERRRRANDRPARI